MPSVFAFRSLEDYPCHDSEFRPRHGPEQRYVDETGRCRPLIVQAVHPRQDRIEWTEVRADFANSRTLGVWLASNFTFANPEDWLLWLMLWVWFMAWILWLSIEPYYSGRYSSYMGKFYGQLWVARSQREYCLRRARLGEEPVYEITHTTHPRRLIIYDPESLSWKICSDESVIRQQKYVAISFPYEVNIPRGSSEQDWAREREGFIRKVETTIASLNETAYWMDLQLVDNTRSGEEVSRDLYLMADIYRGAQFTLIMLNPAPGITEEDAWLRYGERLWTFPEALLSRELRFQFRDGEVTPITLHQLANRAYAHFAQESGIINAYALRDPLERLERLLLLKSALWRRTSGRLQRLEANPEGEAAFFKGDRVYALMGFFEHRIHPHARETQLQAFVRLSMANDNDRIVERMVSLLPPEIPDNACWNAEEDIWGANLWDIETEIQVAGMTESNALVLGGCRAATIRWKNFPGVAFDTQPSISRFVFGYLPFFYWHHFIAAISLLMIPNGDHNVHGWVMLGIAVTLMILAPWLVTIGRSGRIVSVEPWLVGVKGLISADEASTYMYGGTIGGLKRISYSPCGTPLSRTKEGPFRCGDPAQLEELRRAGEADDIYTLIDTLSATLYYFRARRPPTVCLYTGRESGMGRFVLCSERCTINELHKETVVRMPWHISQSMRACDWVALG